MTIVADQGFALYVHWPFCLSKCPYCDFNSHVRDSIDQDRWRSALLTELDHFANETTDRRLTSIFFGGGTPSLMAPATVAAVINRAAGRWQAAADIEITLEANPTSVEANRFADYRAAGVNRVSLGVQALDDDALHTLGRGHDKADALRALTLAARTFPRWSFDLIYARPGQSVADWRQELNAALTLADGHLSLYQLTIEPGTAFHPLAARGALVLPDEDAQAALFETTAEVTDAAGLPAYEISNHARPGEESRHNLTYWRYGDYVGVGPGAHGRLTLGGRKWATRTHRAPEIWLERTERLGHGEHPREQINPDLQWREKLLMGLRLTEGVALDRIATAGDDTPSNGLDQSQLAPLVDGGFLQRDGLRLKATPAGRLRLNAVLAALMG